MTKKKSLEREKICGNTIGTQKITVYFMKAESKIVYRIQHVAFVSIY